METFLKEYLDLNQFNDFHNFTHSQRSNNNIVQRWLADNCKKSDYNNERRKYGIIGNINESIIL